MRCGVWICVTKWNTYTETTFGLDASRNDMSTRWSRTCVEKLPKRICIDMSDCMCRLHVADCIASLISASLVAVVIPWLTVIVVCLAIACWLKCFMTIRHATFYSLGMRPLNLAWLSTCAGAARRSDLTSDASATMSPWGLRLFLH